MKKNLKQSIFTLLLLSLLIGLLPSTALAIEPPQPWKSGDGETHGYILDAAMDIIRNDKGWTPYSELLTYKDVLLKYCDMPDKDEIWYANAYHFYNPITGYNYYPWPTPKSIRRKTAMVMIKQHSLDAKSLYLQGKHAEAFEKLGRAIHYLEDVNVPHHAAGKIAVFSNHTQFEKYVLLNQSRYRATSSDQYDLFINDNWENFSKNLLHHSALHAYGHIYNASYTDGNDEEDRAHWELAAEPVVENAQQAVAAYLYRFLKEVDLVK